MSKAATLTAMEELHAKVAQRLKECLDKDDYSGIDITNAIKFLKDSQVAVAPEDDGSTARLLADIAEATGDDGPSKGDPHPF